MKILNILVRQNLEIGRIEGSLAFYEATLQQSARLRLELLDGRLIVVQVGAMLLVGAAPELLSGFADIGAAYLVEDIDAFATILPTRGARIVEPLHAIATGKAMLVRHPDGLLVEYVEHDDKNPRDRMYA